MVREVEWDELYSMENVDLAAHFIEENIQRIHKEVMPLVKVQPRGSFKPWVTEETKIRMEERDELQEFARITGDEFHWTEYRRCRNWCSREVKKDRRNYLQKQYETCGKEKNTANLYKTVKKQLGREGGGPPSAFLKDGVMKCALIEVANIQADFYQAKNELLARGITPSNKDPLEHLKKAKEDWISRRQDGQGSGNSCLHNNTQWRQPPPSQQNNTAPGVPQGSGNSCLHNNILWRQPPPSQQQQGPEEMKLKEITLAETAEILKQLGNSAARGEDKIDAMSLKLAAAELLAPIQFITNLSIRSERFPSRWKIGKILPLFKGKGANRLDPGSYRPICLLSVIGKIVERAVQQQLNNHMERRGYWSESQHAYRKKHSTATAMLELSDRIFMASDQKLIAVAMSVDESNAFECIQHDILDGKLELYDVGQSARNWVTSYLSYRSNYVEIGGKASAIKSVKRGVPQGSVMGPMLFSMYTNKLPSIVNREDCTDTVHNPGEYLFGSACPNCGAVTQYADDATYLVISKDRDSNQRKITENLEVIKDFLNANHLAINESKTSVIELMNKQKRGRARGVPPKLNVVDERGNPKVLNAVRTGRLLGANLTNDLTWTGHLLTGDKPLLPELRKQVGALKYLSREIALDSRKVLAEGLIVSRILYLLPMWGGTPHKYQRKVQVLMNTAARICTNSARMTSTTTLMQRMNWLTFRELTKYHSLITLWKILRQGVPQYFRGKITLDEDNCTKVVPARILLTGQSFRWRSAHNWNELSQELRDCQSLPRFKRLLKSWLIKQRLPRET